MAVIANPAFGTHVKIDSTYQDINVILFTEAGLLGLINNIFKPSGNSSEEENSSNDKEWLDPKQDTDTEIIHKAVTVNKLENGTEVYDLLAVTDMDKDARSGTDWTWRAVTRKGKLAISEDKKNFCSRQLNAKGRGMELSDLSEFNGRLISPDDKTGMLYEIRDNKMRINAKYPVFKYSPTICVPS
uniref:Ricin B-type lectin domain-containing protein n=1 Tax=Angiostrongylus cantonensis TaxID=6313 RepID=A0A0K0D417_ANGCA